MSFVFDESKRNDWDYMLEAIKQDNSLGDHLGLKLRFSPKFILELVSSKEYKSVKAFFKHIPPKLRDNPNFVISYVTVLRERLVEYTDKDKRNPTPESIDRFKKAFHIYILKQLNVEPYINNEDFWRSIYKLGASTREETIAHYFSINAISYDNPEYIRWFKDRVLEEIKTITPDGFNNKVRTFYRGKADFMFDFVTRKPELYICLSDELKKDDDYNKRLVEMNPEVQRIKDREKQKREAENKEKELNTLRSERTKAKRIEILREEYKKLGKDHPTIALIRKLTASKLTKKLFCLRNKIGLDFLNAAFDEATTIVPGYMGKVTEYMKEVDSRFDATCESILQELLSDNLDHPTKLIEYSKKGNYKHATIFDLLDRCKDPEQKRKLYTIVLNSMKSGEISINGYRRLFWTDFDTEPSRINKNIRVHFFGGINDFYKGYLLEMPYELLKEARIASLVKFTTYEAPYERASFINSSYESNGSKVFVTNDMLESILKYLKDQDEFVCKYSVQNAIKQLASGELVFTDEGIINNNPDNNPPAQEDGGITDI